MISPKVQRTVKALVKKRLGKYRITACEFAEGSDHLGESVIHITLCYGDSKTVINVNDLSGLLYETRPKLQAQGEFRFPKFAHTFDPDQKFRAA